MVFVKPLKTFPKTITLQKHLTSYCLSSAGPRQQNKQNQLHFLLKISFVLEEKNDEIL